MISLTLFDWNYSYLVVYVDDIVNASDDYDNQGVLHIASNLGFHKRTKHREISCQFIMEKVLYKAIVFEFVNSSN